MTEPSRSPSARPERRAYRRAPLDRPVLIEAAQRVRARARSRCVGWRSGPSLRARPTGRQHRRGLLRAAHRRGGGGTSRGDSLGTRNATAHCVSSVWRKKRLVALRSYCRISGLHRLETHRLQRFALICEVVLHLRRRRRVAASRAWQRSSSKAIPTRASSKSCTARSDGRGAVRRARRHPRTHELAAAGEPESVAIDATFGQQGPIRALARLGTRARVDESRARPHAGADRRRRPTLRRNGLHQSLRAGAGSPGARARHHGQLSFLASAAERNRRSWFPTSIGPDDSRMYQELLTTLGVRARPDGGSLPADDDSCARPCRCKLKWRPTAERAGPVCPPVCTRRPFQPRKPCASRSWANNRMCPIVSISTSAVGSPRAPRPARRTPAPCEQLLTRSLGVRWGASELQCRRASRRN